MPARKDLSGEVYGRLTVIRQAGYVEDSKRSALWLCRCECGRTEEISQLKLPHNASQSRKRGTRYECSVCMRGPCAVCGKPIERETRGNTCSDQCYQEKRRRQWNDQYGRSLIRDPDFNKKRAQAERERMAADPELAERVRVRRRQAAERYKAVPENREKILEYGRQWYEKNKDRKQWLNRLWWETMPPEMRELKRRQYWLKSKRKFYDYLEQNPEEYQEYRDRMNTYARERYNKIKQQQALAELRELAGQLYEKLSNE